MSIHSTQLADTSVWLTYWQEDKFHMPTSSYQGIYGVFGVATAVLEMSAAMAMTTMSIRASVNLHDRVLRHVWFSPMSFFDTQPLGRLMGVFTKDMDAMDNELSEILWLLLLLSANVRLEGLTGANLAVARRNRHHRSAFPVLPRHVSGVSITH